MFSKYKIGDTILLTGTVTGIEAVGTPGEEKILYRIREYERPIREGSIVAKIEQPWELKKRQEE